ncbi:beta-1,3-N-acetylglucosaminyltransferase radical fringe [Bos mutus]|uniref:beta-1,3-N-acetylglucosaminyltransferase radical fringe n=1 Tax=Bos mutus TaxID=72004 RepID=UPI0038B41B48
MLRTFIFTDGDDPELQLQGGGHVINTNCSAVHTRQALCCKMSVEYDKFIESGRNCCPPSHPARTSTWGGPAWTTPSRLPRGSREVEPCVLGRSGEEQLRVTTVKFWFATGGAGFCLSRGLALKMSPWASLGGFMSTAERVRLPDDCTVGYIVEGLLGARLLHSSLFHSHLENLQKLSPDTLLQQVTLSYGGPENPQNVVNVAGGFSLQQDPTRREDSRPGWCVRCCPLVVTSGRFPCCSLGMPPFPREPSQGLCLHGELHARLKTLWTAVLLGAAYS